MVGVKFEVVECSYDDNTNMYVAKLKLEDDSFGRKDNNFTEMTARSTLKSCVDEILCHLYRVSLEEINTLFIELCELFLTEKEWLDAAKYHCIAKIYIQFHIKALS